MGMAQCGSILTTTWYTASPVDCALVMASFSYSVHSAAFGGSGGRRFSRCCSSSGRFSCSLFGAQTFSGGGCGGQILNFLAEGLCGRHLAATAVGRDHVDKDVGGGKGDLGDGGLGGGGLKRQGVFELMGQFAEFAQATSGGVSL